MTDSVPFQRRSTDFKRHDIEAMIAEENDPKQRAFLIILNSINTSLLANTKTIQDVSRSLEDHLERYDAHVASEEALLNKGKGMWKVMAWVLAAVQTIAIGLVVRVDTHMSDINKSIESLAMADAHLVERVTSLEKGAVNAQQPPH